MRRGSLAALAATALLLLGACSSTVLRSGLAPGRTAPGFEKRWHASFLFGAIPFHETYELGSVCPEGWSEVRLSADEFTVAAGLLTAFLYSPSRLTVICAAVGDPAPPPLEAYRPPTLGRSDP